MKIKIKKTFTRGSTSHVDNVTKITNTKVMRRIRKKKRSRKPRENNTKNSRNLKIYKDKVVRRIMKIKTSWEDRVWDAVEDDPVNAEVIVEERNGDGKNDEVRYEQQQHHQVPVEPVHQVPVEPVHQVPVEPVQSQHNNSWNASEC